MNADSLWTPFRLLACGVFFVAALSSCYQHAVAHDIYTDLHADGKRSGGNGQLCCGGDDCEATAYEVLPDGSAIFHVRKNFQGDVRVAASKITWLPVPGGEASEAHWCGAPRTKVFQAPVNDENPDLAFWTYCAFIAPGGV